MRSNEDPEIAEIKEKLVSAEKRLDRLYERRNELNDQARAQREARDRMNDQKRHLLDQAHELKDKRDALNTKAKAHRERRNKLQAEAKRLIEIKRNMRRGAHGGAIGRVADLEGRIKALHFEQETSSNLTIEKENELLKRIQELQGELDTARNEAAEESKLLENIDDVDERIDELFREADREHEQAIKISDQAQVYHEKADPLFAEVRYLHQSSDERHAAYVDLREKADAVHQKIVDMRETVLGYRDERREVREERDRIVKEQNEQVRENLDGDEALDDAADEAVELLLKKKRVEL